MNIIDKIVKKQADRHNEKSVTIVCLGDSVTEGCFNDYVNGEGRVATEFQRTCAYAEKLKEILALLYPTVQINVINSGLSGTTARISASRLNNEVLSFSPDLVVVSYGLNDSEYGTEGLETYGQCLAGIFERVKASGAEVIFLTQNYMCTEISHDIKDKALIDFAKIFCEIQNSGMLEKYFEKAKEVCKKYDVAVCDLYHVWDRMYHSGVNVDGLLANKLNHPIREYHYYVAIKLAEIILGV